MTTLAMNERLLGVLCALKAKQDLAVCETSLPGYPADWSAAVKTYFFSMPDDLIASVGLRKNEYCFDAIVSLQIPDVWLNTEYDQLEQFHFCY